MIKNLSPEKIHHGVLRKRSNDKSQGFQFVKKAEEINDKEDAKILMQKNCAKMLILIV